MNDIARQPAAAPTPALRPPCRRRRGFTLIEILVVVGIIVILLAIAIPVVGRVRRAAQVATVQAQINDIQGSIQQYTQDYGALPGPIDNDNVRRQTFTMNVDTSAPNAGEFVTATGWDAGKITMSENLVLALAGGLEAVAGTSPLAIRYDPTLVGGGAMSLNPANPKKGRAYIDAKNLSWRVEGPGKTGKFKDGAGEADDTIIPEIVDTFSSPMPILYLRAMKGRSRANPAQAATETDNAVITNVPDPATVVRGHYDVSQYVGYVTPPTAGAGYIGEGKAISPGDYEPASKRPTNAGQLPHGLAVPDPTKNMDPGDTANYEFPYNAYPYFRDPASGTTNPQPRSKDGYILISAGADRVYGTADDITSFGPVAP